MSTLRHAVLTALGLAREKVARGSPSMRAVFHYMRLTDKAWAEVDRAIDDVRFEPGPAPFAYVPTRVKGESWEVAEFRDAMESAKRNAFLPWEDPHGLTRAGCVALITCAIERTRAVPVLSEGPLFHNLPFNAEG